MARKRHAPRRPAFVGVCNCGQPICAEREQLHRVAQFAPRLPTRLTAMSFLGMLEAVDRGVYGGIQSAESLFD